MLACKQFVKVSLIFVYNLVITNYNTIMEIYLTEIVNPSKKHKLGFSKQNKTTAHKSATECWTEHKQHSYCPLTALWWVGWVWVKVGGENVGERESVLGSLTLYL